MRTASGPRAASDRVRGGDLPPPPTVGIMAQVYNITGGLLWDSSGDLATVSNQLAFPAPLEAAAYALADSPRFYAPPWGPTPIPKDVTVDPALQATNGYDFRNDIAGDTYVFIVGSSLDQWHAARHTLLKLTGPTPLLPDFAFGTWFTYWHSCKCVCGRGAKG